MQKENYFLVYPENKDFLSGKTREFAALQYNSSQIFFMTLFCLGGILWIYLFITSLSEYIKLAHHGGQTKAQFVSQREEYEQDRGTTYYITYKYIVDDIQYIKEKIVNFDLYALFRTSQNPQEINFVVYYYKKDPNLSIPYPPSLEEPLFLFIGSFFWFFISFTILIYLKNKREKLKKLSQAGKIIDGRLTYCKSSESDNDLELDGRYYFLSPRTRRYIEGKFSNIKRNDLKKKPLPEPDTPVKIMYWDDDNYEIL